MLWTREQRSCLCHQFILCMQCLPFSLLLSLTITLRWHEMGLWGVGRENNDQIWEGRQFPLFYQTHRPAFWLGAESQEWRISDIQLGQTACSWPCSRDAILMKGREQSNQIFQPLRLCKNDSPRPKAIGFWKNQLGVCWGPLSSGQGAVAMSLSPVPPNQVQSVIPRKINEHFVHERLGEICPSLQYPRRLCEEGEAEPLKKDINTGRWQN